MAEQLQIEAIEGVAETLDAIADLTEKQRAELALGPLPEPECRICAVLRPDGHHPVSESAEVIVDWHQVQFVEKLLACAGMLGTSGKPTTAEVESLRGTLIAAEGSDLRDGIDRLADQLGFARCLLVYLLAGWTPDFVDLPGTEES